MDEDPIPSQEIINNQQLLSILQDIANIARRTDRSNRLTHEGNRLGSDLAAVLDNGDICDIHQILHKANDPQIGIEDIDEEALDQARTLARAWQKLKQGEKAPLSQLLSQTADKIQSNGIYQSEKSYQNAISAALSVQVPELQLHHAALQELLHSHLHETSDQDKMLTRLSNAQRDLESLDYTTLNEIL